MWCFYQWRYYLRRPNQLPILCWSLMVMQLLFVIHHASKTFH